MTARLLNLILSYTKLGAFLDDHKTVIGAALLVLAKLLEALQAVAPMFPEALYLVTAEDGLRDALNVAISTLESVGYPLTGIGLARKYVKAKLPDAK